METLSDLLGIKKTELKKLAVAWIYSYNLMKQGDKSTFALAQKILKVDPIIMDITKMTAFSYGNQSYFNQEKYLHRLRMILIDEMKDNIKELEDLNGKPIETLYESYYFSKETDQLAEDLGYKTDKKLITSPFIPTPTNTLQDIKDFATIVEVFIDIKKGAPANL